MRGVLALLLFIGCADPKLSGAATDLTIEPGELRFANGWVGLVDEQVVTFKNRGQVAQALELKVSGPFAIARESLNVGGGFAETVVVRFAPSAAGDFDGELAITGDVGTEVVKLSASARVPPVCSAPACHVATFDHETGACIDVAAADGSPCSDACLDEPRCMAGACVGKPKPCDDDNKCTFDRCEPGVGCVHEDTSASCPKPANPCHVATCDPDDGCGEKDASDYTPCGPVSCEKANVCLSGYCMAFDPPEGFVCGKPTPCRGPATCQNKQCVAPPAGDMQELWRYDLHTVLGPVAADDSGNVYWADRDAAWRAWRLVSVSAAGQLRYEVSLPYPGYDFPIAAVGEFVVVGPFAFRASDGTLAAPTSSIGRASRVAGAAIEAGHVTMASYWSIWNGISVRLIDATTNEILWERDFQHAGNFQVRLIAPRTVLVVNRYTSGAVPHTDLTAVDERGAVAWSASFDGVLTGSSGQVAYATGLMIWPSSSSPLLGDFGWPGALDRTTGASLWLNAGFDPQVATASKAFGCHRGEVVAWEVASGKRAWSNSTRCEASLALLEGPTVLAHTFDSASRTTKVLGLDGETGRTEFTCNVAGASVGSVVRNSLLTYERTSESSAPSSIVVRSLAPYTLAKKGWVVPEGNPGLSNYPR